MRDYLSDDIEHAEERGREAEREAVAAWLERRIKHIRETRHRCNWPADVATIWAFVVVELADQAADIRAGKHREGR